MGAEQFDRRIIEAMASAKILICQMLKCVVRFYTLDIIVSLISVKRVHSTSQVITFFRGRRLS